MSFGESLTKIRKSKGISRKDLAEQLDIPYTTLRNYETDQREPGHKLLIKIANLLSVSVDELVGYQGKKEKAPSLSDEAMKLATDYDDLDGHGKRVVRLVADEEKARCEEEERQKQAAILREQREEMEAGEEIEPRIICLFPGYSMPMSAGTGQPAEDEYPEYYRLIKKPPRGATFIAPVSGNSMEPTFHDGDKLFILACTEIEPGQIGVFFMDGQMWVKELGDGVLISHNPDPEYAPRAFTSDIRCQGLVLGVCDDSYFE